LCSKEWNFWVLLLVYSRKRRYFFLFTYFPVIKIVAQLATFCSFGIDFFSVSLYNDIEDKTKTDGGI